jgi:hypothetical protein
MEPDADRHHVCHEFGDAYAAWLALPAEVRETIASPRQSHDCWIFDKD